jgi:hypothetical protein
VTFFLFHYILTTQILLSLLVIVLHVLSIRGALTVLKADDSKLVLY